MRMNAKDAKMDQCKVPYCIIKFIDNADDMKVHFPTADAVIFQGNRMPDNPPQRHHTNQVYVFASIESPLHLMINPGKDTWINAINWTMTYRLDSDIPYKYGEIKLKSNMSEKSSDTIKNFVDIYRKKTKEVAWFVSDCVTESLREKYVKTLQKYINVDIYGKCGHYHNCTKEEGEKCLQQIAHDYKFYLSFENSICNDYMTEKVFTWFDQDIINVVRGARRYSKLLPNNTYINAHHFQSATMLAKYLQTVSQSEQRYAKYLQIKDKYTTEPLQSQYRNAYCDLCERLHSVENYAKVYEDVRTWWSNGMCIQWPKDYS